MTVAEFAAKHRLDPRIVEDVIALFRMPTDGDSLPPDTQDAICRVLGLE